MRSEKGFSLIEIIVATALLGIVAVTLLTGMSIAFKTAMLSKQKVAVESLAKSQLESIKNQAYISATVYDPQDALKRYTPITVSDDLTAQGYSVAINTPQTVLNPDGDSNEVQNVTVVVKRNSNDVFTATCFKLSE